MKKQFFSKTLAMMLALMMVIALIPMSTLVVSAATLTEDNLDDDVITIMNEADWNVVANADKDFAGQTIKLGDDITFTEAAPVLFKHANGFKGTFYGCGKTVSGTAVDGINLIATKVVGGTIDGSDGAENSTLKMTVSGFTVDTTASTGVSNATIIAGTIQDGTTVANIQVNSCSVLTMNSGSKDTAGNCIAIVVGTIDNSGSNKNYSIVSNCTVNNCTVDAKAQSGIVVGIVNGYGKVNSCTVTGTSEITANRGAVSAVVGKANGGATVEISGCTVGNQVQVKNNTVGSDYAVGLGMILGQAGKTSDITNGSVSISECTAYGSIKAKNWDAKNPVAAGGLVGMVNVSGECDIKDNTLNVLINYESGNAVVYMGGVVGHVMASAVISNCDVEAKIVASNSAAGGIVGYNTARASSSLSISGCNVTGYIYEKFDGSGSPALGGIIGSGSSASDATAAASINGKSTIEKCHVNMNIFALSTSKKIGGIIGKWGYSVWNSAEKKTDYYDMPVTLTINDCLVEGTYDTRSAGIIYEYVAKKSTLNVSNVVVSANMGQETFNSSTKTATTTKDVTTIGSGSKVYIGALNSAVSSSLAAHSYSNNYTTVGSYTSYGFTTIPNTAEFIDGLIKFENETTDDKIVEIRDHYNCNLVQVTTDGTFAIRFISSTAIELKDTDVLEMSVEATLGDENRTFKSNNKDKPAEFGPFASLKAYGDTQIVNASEYGAKQFCAIIVKGIPMEDASTLEFTITLTLNEVQVATCVGTIPAAAFAA